MFNFNQKEYDESIKNYPSDDSSAIISTIFANNNKIGVDSLSLTILDLIKDDQIKCDIDLTESYEIGNSLTSKDMEAMKEITLRIANKGELKTSESLAIKLLKNMAKNKKFNLKFLAKQSNKSSICDKFAEDFNAFVKAFQNENEYDGKNYKNILKDGKLTQEGKELKEEWKNFQVYLKSKDLTEKYPPETALENSQQIVYAACFDLEREALKNRENNSPLTDFIDKEGYEFLNIIFNNALSNVPEKRKGDGIFYGVNDKYTIPGGG